jgi:outer membrane protein OmpA-like peptidoglycan-associated protein
MNIIINKNKYMKETFTKLAQIIKQRWPEFKKTLNNKALDATLAGIAQIRKRNVVSCFPFSQAPLSGRHSIALNRAVWAVLAAVVSMAVAHPLLAATALIQEETAKFHSETVRYPVANTFLIKPWTAKHKQACNGREAGSKKICRLPTVHFQLGSAKLTSSQKQTLLDGLQQCAVQNTTPLHVTGYTCPLGSQEENRVLSLRRAAEVGGILRANGYTVKNQDIQGRGDENPLTNDQRNFATNRRVEISED